MHLAFKTSNESIVCHFYGIGARASAACFQHYRMLNLHTQMPTRHRCDGLMGAGDLFSTTDFTERHHRCSLAGHSLTVGFWGWPGAQIWAVWPQPARGCPDFSRENTVFRGSVVFTRESRVLSLIGVLCMRFTVFFNVLLICFVFCLFFLFVCKVWWFLQSLVQSVWLIVHSVGRWMESVWWWK